MTRTQVAKACYKTDIASLASNTMVQIVAQGLSSASERIRTLGSCYQDYRITKVNVKFMPVYNAMSGVPGSAFLPQILTKQMDIPKLPIATEHYLDQLDPKVHVLTQKDITISFSPKVDMLADQDGPGASTSIIIKKSPWLSTNLNAVVGGAWLPDTTFHFGLLALVTAGAGFTTNPVNYQAEVFYEFRKPQDGVTSTHNYVELPSQLIAL